MFQVGDALRIEGLYRQLPRVRGRSGAGCGSGLKTVLGQPLMQPVPDLVGGVGAPLPLITRYHRTAGDNSGDTGQADPLPNAAHN
jgi:hypothetical protein